MNIASAMLKYAKSLIDDTKPVTVKDLRLGLGYSIIELSDGSAGVAWTPDTVLNSGCNKLMAAGSFKGSPVTSLITMLESESHLEKTIGLAIFNALNSRIHQNFIEQEAVSILDIQPQEKVVMVGYFSPVIPRVQATGCSLKIVELNKNHSDIISSEEGYAALAECDVAIITATSVINGTIDKLLSSLGNKNETRATMLGPSTPLCPEVFKKTGISYLSGSIVENVEGAKTVVSEGGGTRMLKKHLKFVTVRV